MCRKGSLPEKERAPQCLSLEQELHQEEGGLWSRNFTRRKGMQTRGSHTTDSTAVSRRRGTGLQSSRKGHSPSRPLAGTSTLGASGQRAYTETRLGSQAEGRL